MEFKADALLLRAVDYGENDKMVTLLTAERGKIGVGMKGVKKAGAKLKFAAQPFCFAEYVLSGRGERYTVISASLHDGFYPLREDVTAYYAAACVCEACDALVFEGMQAGALLVAAITALGEMCGGSVPRALIRFLLTALRLAGYPVLTEDCAACGKALSGKLFFDFASGSFFCAECAVGTLASEVTLCALRAAESGTGQTSPDGEKRALRLLGAYFSYQTEQEISSISELLKLL